MPRKPRTWRERQPPAPWTEAEDRVLLEMSDLGIGMHELVLDAVLPGRTVREAIERRFELRRR